MGATLEPRHILIARTDSIGDVVLTLPVTTFLKNHFPGIKISFLGQSYTKPVIECCSSVDDIYEWNKITELSHEEQLKTIRAIGADTVIHVFPDKHVARLCKRAGIRNRIATSHRLFTWFTCNYKVNFDRKNSELHESQLNFKLLQPLGINKIPAKDELIALYNFHSPVPSAEMRRKVKSSKKNIILHPKSKGSAREWGLENFRQLVHLLPADQYEIFISGVKEDEPSLSKMFVDSGKPDHVHFIAGQFSLSEFIAFISTCDGMVAASTGPLHIAAALGKNTIGLFVPLRPIHPGRWEPIGKNAIAITGKEKCGGCAMPLNCDCMQSITPEMVRDLLISRLMY